MLRKAAFSAFMTLAAACATSTRPPAQSASTSAGAGVDDADADADPASETAEGAEAADEDAGVAESGPCRADMVLVANGSERFCVDKYEASLAETDADGNERPYPHYLPVDGHAVRAVSTPGVYPQGFISEVQADDACAASGKRLCTPREWKTACMGPSKTTFPYGSARQTGVCNDNGKSAVGTVFGFQRLADPVATNAPTPPPIKATSTKTESGKPTRVARATGRPAHATSRRAAATTRPRATRTEPAITRANADKPTKKGQRTANANAKSDRTVSSKPASRRTPARTPARESARPASVEPSVWSQLNDPRLGQVDGALARTGSHEECVNGYGVVDIVGNLHEWVKTDPNAPHGTFAGGYYLDTALNGDGCNYRTTAHAHDYHDYSTGFRCCADAR